MGLFILISQPKVVTIACLSMSMELLVSYYYHHWVVVSGSIIQDTAITEYTIQIEVLFSPKLKQEAVRRPNLAKFGILRFALF